jgi:hypothetical protein
MILPLRKKYVKTISGIKIYLVNGEKIKLKHIEFVEGGNGYRYNWIPKNEIWIDEVFKGRQRQAIILHEITEVRKMKKGMSYEKAHKFSNEVEKKYRLKLLHNK